MRNRLKATNRPSLAQFHFHDREHGNIEVRFCFDADGTSSVVSFFRGEEADAARIVANHHGEYKPCMTHARELLREFLEKPVRGNHAKQRAGRAKKAKPVLKVFGTEVPA